MRQVLFRKEAEADVTEAYLWYEARSPGMGEEFRHELASTLRRIADHPESYQMIHRETRRAPMHRFPYSVFYRVYPDKIIVVACMHGRRSPRRWRSRSTDA